jgi:hypothetical protein
MRKRVNLLFAALATLAAAGSAAAQTVNWPGGNCVTAHGSPAVGATHWSGDFGTDSTTATLLAYCPVETSGVDDDVSRAGVVFLDRHPTENACCTLTSQFFLADGTVWGHQSAAMCSTGAGTHMQGASVDADFGTLGRNMQFQCTIPRRTSLGRSAIFNYEVVR